MGQVAVAWVVRNRMEDERWSRLACGVVYEKAQFTDVHLSKPDYQSAEWERAKKVALLVMLGGLPDPTLGARWFYNPKKVREPRWAKQKKVTSRIANHVFLSDP